MSERPGGFAPNHRKVRRQEEIIWLQVQGFTRVISLLPSSHNLQAYEEQVDGQRALPPAASRRCPCGVLGDLYRELHGCLTGGERILIHQEELGDRIIGVVAGYLLWSERLPSGPQAITVLEHMTGHPMGPSGRELVAFAAELSPAPSTRRAGDAARRRVTGTAGAVRWPARRRRRGPGDRIQLRGLRAFGTHGVLPEEKSRAQPFEIDLDLDVDLAPAGRQRPAGRHRRLRRDRRDGRGHRLAGPVVRSAGGAGRCRGRGRAGPRRPHHRGHRAPPQAAAPAGHRHRHRRGPDHPARR